MTKPVKPTKPIRPKSGDELSEKMRAINMKQPLWKKQLNAFRSLRAKDHKKW